MCGHGSGNGTPCAGRAICASFDPLGVYIYAVGVESCATRLPLLRSVPLTDPNRGRAWHPREFGAVLGVSASLPLPAPPLPSSSRRYAPQCFVGGIPPSRLATCLTAHPTNRVAACRSVRHSSPRPLPHLPQGAFVFVASALADVPSARLTLSAYPPERSGVAEGELNAGCKSAAALSDLDTTDAIRPQADPAISSRQIRRAGDGIWNGRKGDRFGIIYA